MYSLEGATEAVRERVKFLFIFEPKAKLNHVRQSWYSFYMFNQVISSWLATPETQLLI